MVRTEGLVFTSVSEFIVFDSYLDANSFVVLISANATGDVY